MANAEKLPFKVGELAEARSFQIGFRGAWFRCKIKEISRRKGRLGHLLEYYDFPDEKMKWTRLYQVPCQYVGKGKEKHRELMLRPHYPPIYNEKQMPHVSEISEVTVIVNNSWKVGDLVDWWTTGCYWSGRITRLFGDGEAQIELNPPPLGEGSCYESLLKDLRPSLDWSPEHGWTIPTQEGNSGRPCARLIKPISQGEETEAFQGSAGSSAPVSSSSEEGSTRITVMPKLSLGTRVSKERKDEQRDSSTRKTSDANTDSGQNSAEPVADEDLNFNSSSKKYEAGGVTLNSMQSDTLEAAIFDLEEYVNKVKWLKTILQYGISSSDSHRPCWEFVEPQASSEIPK